MHRVGLVLPTRPGSCCRLDQSRRRRCADGAGGRCQCGRFLRLRSSSSLPLTPRCRSPWRKNSSDNGVMDTGPGYSCGILWVGVISLGMGKIKQAPVPHGQSSTCLRYSHDIERVGPAVREWVRHSNGCADMRRAAERCKPISPKPQQAAQKTQRTRPNRESCPLAHNVPRDGQSKMSANTLGERMPPRPSGQCRRKHATKHGKGTGLGHFASSNAAPRPRRSRLCLLFLTWLACGDQNVPCLGK